MIRGNTRRALKVAREDGLGELYSKVKKRLSHVGPTAFVRDLIIVKLALDPYSLRMHHRYEDIYFKSRAAGTEKRELICAHTNRQYDDGESVLDIGCGPGQLAAAFARQNPELNYVGIEPQREKVSALKRQYKRTNFTFRHVDLENSYYNPDGSKDPTTTDFESVDRVFDLVVLSSVFTHIRPPAVRNYLNHFPNLLADGGKVWATCYLITEDNDRWLKDDRDFEFGFDGFFSPHETLPERSIAYPREGMYDMVDSAGLRVRDCIFGSWRGGEYEFDRNRFYQDVLVLERA